MRAAQTLGFVVVCRLRALAIVIDTPADASAPAVGDDVTEQILKGTSIPTELDEAFTGDVRGEVIVPVAFFRGLEKDSAVSARNYAAGSLRQKNASEVSGRGLRFVVHDVVGGADDYTERRAKAQK